MDVQKLIEEIKFDIRNQWNLGWYKYESWQDDISVEFLNYFRSRDFRVHASVIGQCHEIYTVDIYWDNTKSYESYFPRIM